MSLLMNILWYYGIYMLGTIALLAVGILMLDLYDRCMPPRWTVWGENEFGMKVSASYRSMEPDVVMSKFRQRFPGYKVNSMHPATGRDLQRLDQVIDEWRRKNVLA